MKNTILRLSTGGNFAGVSFDGGYTLGLDVEMFGKSKTEFGP